MKLEPDITSWALGELTENERRSLQKRAAESPKFAAEADDAKEFCQFLHKNLGSQALTFTDDEREQVRHAIRNAVIKPKKLGKHLWMWAMPAAAACLTLLVLTYAGKRPNTLVSSTTVASLKHPSTIEVSYKHTPLDPEFPLPAVTEQIAGLTKPPDLLAEFTQAPVGERPASPMPPSERAFESEPLVAEVTSSANVLGDASIEGKGGRVTGRPVPLPDSLELKLSTGENAATPDLVATLGEDDTNSIAVASAGDRAMGNGRGQIAAATRTRRALPEKKSKMASSDKSQRTPATGKPQMSALSDPTTSTQIARPSLGTSFFPVSTSPMSTFPTVVNTSSYLEIQGYIDANEWPPKAAVRTEELVNFFSYRDAETHADSPVAVEVEIADAPWNPKHRLARIHVTFRAAAQTGPDHGGVQVEFNSLKVASYRLLGYENQAARHPDFPKVNEGDITLTKAHSVTAFYEIVTPVENQVAQTAATPRYQKPRAPELLDAAQSGESFTVTIHYQNLDTNQSGLLTYPVRDAGKTLDQASTDFRFGAAVVAFGKCLRDLSGMEKSTWERAKELAEGAKGDDPQGERTAFLQRMMKVEKLDRARP